MTTNHLTREDWSAVADWVNWNDRPTDEGYQRKLVEKLRDTLHEYDSVEQSLEMLYYERAVQNVQLDYWLPR